MFENNYIAAFSKVTASEETRQEVLKMAENRKNTGNVTFRRFSVLAAAAALMAALTLTVFAAEDIVLWFQSWFGRNGDTELTQQQITFLSENEQAVGQSVTLDGWTMELRSVIHDDAVGYMIFSVTAPEEILLREDISRNTYGELEFNFGNFGTRTLSQGMPELVKASEGIQISGWGFQWMEDGDGRANTRSLVIHITPHRAWQDPFGSDAEYYIHFDNIILETEDEEYRKALTLEKYKGVKHPQFTQEEQERIYREEVLAEGIWEFTVSFADPGNSRSESVELLKEPVVVKSSMTYMEDGELMEAERKLTLHSVTLRHLTVSFRYGASDGYPDLSVYVSVTNSDGTGFMGKPDEKRLPCVVLKDGTEIPLLYLGHHDSGCVTLEAESPIVFEEVLCIRMADGTILPMPEGE